VAGGSSAASAVGQGDRWDARGRWSWSTTGIVTSIDPRRSCRETVNPGLGVLSYRYALHV
jgi:hypothetical protein